MKHFMSLDFFHLNKNKISLNNSVLSLLCLHSFVTSIIGNTFILFFKNLRLETTVLMKEESSNIDDVFLLATAFKITAPNMKILLSYSL